MRLVLILAADFDERAGDPSEIQLEGYRAHWADADKIERTETTSQEQLGLALWSTVQIESQRNELYPDQDAGGQISINLTTIIIAVTAIGVALVPLLLAEEKESQPLEALLVSPARYWDVVFGKAAVGLAYCLLVLAVALLFNHPYVVNWAVILLAALLCAAFSVSPGMLVGVLSDNPTSAAIWASPIIFLVLAPTVLGFFMRPDWPPIVEVLLCWSPGSVMFNLFRISVPGEIPGALLWANTAALAGMAEVVLLAAGWLIRRSHRLRPFG